MWLCSKDGGKNELPKSLPTDLYISAKTPLVTSLPPACKELEIQPVQSTGNLVNANDMEIQPVHSTGNSANAND